MNKKVFVYHTILPASIELSWDFFSNPRNLENITTFPSVDVQAIHTLKQGDIIEMEMKVMGLTRKWIAEIQYSESQIEFIDKALNPPFPMRAWQHKHTFIDLGHNTLMIDTVELETILPCRLLNIGLTAMFKQREKKIHKIFSKAFNQKETFSVPF